MNDEDFLWSAEEDIKWCGNIAIGAGLLLMIAGVVFIRFVDSAASRCYVMTAAVIFGLLFGAVGVGSHWWVHRKIQRTTIRRPEGWVK